MSSVAAAPDFPDFRSFSSHVESNGTAMDFTMSIDVVAGFLCRDHVRFFDTASDPNGKPWKPISKVASDSRFLKQIGGGKVGDGKFGKTREREFRAMGFAPDHQLLVDTGAMRISTVYRGAENHVEVIEKTRLEWGSADPKADKHEFGAISRAYNEREERWVEIETPARPFIGWSEVAVNFAVNAVADDAVRLLVAGL